MSVANASEVTGSAQQIRDFRGPALFSYGFRPFFLFGAIWAAVVMALWLPLLAGAITLPTAFGAVRWHAHELIYGYAPAIIAGFLLTAVPNWTGRLPVVGARLFALFAVWAAGRFAVLFSNLTGAMVAAAIDLLFLGALGALVARELVAGNNSRNLKVLVPIAVLAAGNVAFHAEAATSSGRAYGTRMGIAAILFLIMLIGGRIIPSFTRNWLVRHRPGRLPSPFARFDRMALGCAGAALLAWVAAPDSRPTAWLAGVAGLLHLGRLVRWVGWRTVREPLLAFLHIAYAFVPVGFALLALTIWRPEVLLPSTALHAWTAGAIGSMTLAVMTRASLGHTGKPLTANDAVRLIYIAVVLAAIARMLAGFGVARDLMLELSAAGWICAFAGFAAVFGPLLMRRSADG